MDTENAATNAVVYEVPTIKDQLIAGAISLGISAAATATSVVVMYGIGWASEKIAARKARKAAAQDTPEDNE